METRKWGFDCHRRLSLLFKPFFPRTFTGKPSRSGELVNTDSARNLLGGTYMRFLTAVILSISLTAGAANAAERMKQKEKTGTTEKKRHSGRAKSFFRSVGSFSGSLIMPEAYQELHSTKKAR